MPRAEPDDEARARVLSLLKRHGRNTTSFQVLEPGFRYWFEGDDACVAYAEAGAAWVVAGIPIAPPERVVAVANRFEEAARARRKRVRYFGVEAHGRLGGARGYLKVGEQPVWDPRGWFEVLRRKRSLREQLRRARAKGVSCRLVSAWELSDGRGPTRRAIDP